MIVQFVLELLFEVDEHDAAVLVLYGPESVGFQVDDEGAALQVGQFALQVFIFLGQFGILVLQAALAFLGICAFGFSGRNVSHFNRSGSGRL